MNRTCAALLVVGGVAAAIIGGVALCSSGPADDNKQKQLSGMVKGKTKRGGMTSTFLYKKDMPLKQRLAVIQDLTWKSVQDPRMRQLALAITRNCPERDGTCEARAIYHAVKNRVRYTGDVGKVKQGARGIAEEVDLYQSAYRTWEFGGGDCLPMGTLLLVEGHKFTPIEKLLVGSRIWGRDSWTTVKDVWFKGLRSVDAVFLNNGSSFKATSDHKVYVAICDRHTAREGKPCACPVTERRIDRIPVSELRAKDVLVSPERIAFGTETLDPDRALIEGFYLADGWVGHNASFDISGRDGHPKEAQKGLIQEICARMGIPTYWHEKYVRVKDKAWTARIEQMGHKAWLKHALSVNLDEGAAGALLRGIMADSGKNTHGSGRTFTTTSRELMLQTRLLHKMFGITCSERYIVDHGGAGEHPIWRLGVRDQNRSDGRSEKLLRVKSIERNVMEMPVFDLTTEDHYVYLPEADVTVSNCDDNAILSATLLTLNGIDAEFRVVDADPSPLAETWSHIYAIANLPKGNPTRKVALDTTLPGSENFGREPPWGKKRDFVA